MPSTAIPDELRFLGKRETVEHLYKLIDASKKHLFLVSPFLRIAPLRDLRRSIDLAIERGVAVTLVTGIRLPNGDDDRIIDGLLDDGMRLFIVDDLHAKIYLSERHALVSSLNLTDASLNRSIEIGAWVPRGRPEYGQIVDFMRREVQPGLLELTADQVAFCIACATEIEWDLKQPHCDPSATPG